MSFLVPYVETDLDRFVKAVLLDLDAAGALADYLDEHDGPTAPYISGKPSASRGTLLRRRWMKWKKDRDKKAVVKRLFDRVRAMHDEPAWLSFEAAQRFADRESESVDNSFRDYILRHFGPKFIRR